METFFFNSLCRMLNATKDLADLYGLRFYQQASVLVSVQVNFLAIALVNGFEYHIIAICESIHNFLKPKMNR